MHIKLKTAWIGFLGVVVAALIGLSGSLLSKKDEQKKEEPSTTNTIINTNTQNNIQQHNPMRTGSTKIEQVNTPVATPPPGIGNTSPRKQQIVIQEISGYVPRSVLASNDGGEISPGASVTIRKDGTNLRNSPSLESPGKFLQEGTEATVVFVQNSWAKITLKGETDEK